MTYYNKQVLKPTSVNRSRAEDILISLIGIDFPSVEVLPNDRTLLQSGLEIDVLLPTLCTAIELNGPVHYRPIYGKERLIQVQSKDVQKHHEINATGFELIVVDISKLNGTKRTKEFITNVYNSHIRPRLVSKNDALTADLSCK